MSRSDSLQGSLALLVLKILARRGPMHGYGLTLQIEGMSKEVLRVEQGSLYPALHRMEEEGWIEAKWAKTNTQRRARMYEITAQGLKELEAAEARWEAVTAAVGHILQQA